MRPTRWRWTAGTRRSCACDRGIFGTRASGAGRRTMTTRLRAPACRCRRSSPWRLDEAKDLRGRPGRPPRDTLTPPSMAPLAGPATRAPVRPPRAAGVSRMTPGRPRPTLRCPNCGRPIRRSTGDRAPRITCPRCRYLIFDYPRSCAGMVVIKGDRALMLRRGEAPKRGYLDFPGGFMEAGESFEQAARRELVEETGLRVGPAEPLGLWW